MNFETVISVLGLLGIGGAISSYCTILWQRFSTNQQKKQDYKEVRYKCTIQLMYGFLEGPDSISKINLHGGRNFSTTEDILDEIKNEWCNMILFASDDVLRDIREFIISPSPDTYFKSALSMRKDLWGGKIRLSTENIKFKITEQGAAANP